jgi:hypothetical protein
MEALRADTFCYLCVLPSSPGSGQNCAMPTDRKTALAAIAAIAAGDIFHAEGSTGSSRTCIAMAIRHTTILARDISIQAIYEFDRATGVATRYFGSTACTYTIDSVAPLPDDIREIMLELDQKYHEGEYRRAENPNWERPLQDAALTEQQIQAYLFCADYYRAHPI